MAYTLPTLDDFRVDFPLFEDVEDEPAQFALDLAARFVDNSWIEADYARAIKLLAAHYLQSAINEQSTSGSGSTTESINVGPITIRTVSAASAKGQFSYGTTSFGTQFEDLLRANQSGPLVI
jgi:hypothetical protein